MTNVHPSACETFGFVHEATASSVDPSPRSSCFHIGHGGSISLVLKLLDGSYRVPILSTCGAFDACDRRAYESKTFPSSRGFTRRHAARHQSCPHSVFPTQGATLERRCEKRLLTSPSIPSMTDSVVSSVTKSGRHLACPNRFSPIGSNCHTSPHPCRP